MIYFLFICSEEKIDKESFECLNEETIKKVITKSGPQALFLKRWRIEYGYSMTNIEFIQVGGIFT